MLGLIWGAGRLLFATGADRVAEVLPPVECTPLPSAPPWVRGMFRYRGNLVPLIDVHQLMNLDRREARMSNRILVVRCSRADAPHHFLAGLWVDHVLELERLDPDDASGHPGLANPQTPFLGPVLHTRFGQLQLVNPESLITPEQAELLSGRMKEAAA